MTPILNNYDYVLIDCPPHLGITTQNAMLISDYFVVPVIPEFLSLQGLELIQKRIAGLKEKYGEEVKIEFAGCIINKLDLRRKQDSVPIASVLYYDEKELEKLIEKGENTLSKEEKAILKYVSERFRGGKFIDYKPFKWWLPDAKPLYTITDYAYPERTGKEKYFDFYQKYRYMGIGGLTPLRNPLDWEKLKRYKEKVDIKSKRVYVNSKITKTYWLFDRIAILCKELIERTKKYEKR